MTTTIHDLCREANDTARTSGWWDGVDANDPNVRAAKIALMHSELSEALEEVRLGDEHIDIRVSESGKPEGMAVELADVLIRIGDLCGQMGIDLEHAVEIKLAYNKRRSYRHGGKKL